MKNNRPWAAEVKIGFAATRPLLAREQDSLLDEALLQTFPASDPVSITLAN